MDALADGAALEAYAGRAAMEAKARSEHKAG